MAQRMTSGDELPHEPDIEDTRDPYWEQRYHVRIEAEKEQFTGERIAEALVNNFYLSSKLNREQMLGLIPRQNLVLGELTGLPASGKHIIAARIERMLTDIDPSLVVRESDITAYVLKSGDYKRMFREDEVDPMKGPFDRYNVFLSRLGLWSLYTQILRHSDSPWCISTRGPSNTFQMMMQIDGNHELYDIVDQAAWVETVQRSGTVTELANDMPEDIYNAALRTAAGILNKTKVHDLMPTPLVRSPIPITFISGLPIDTCLENFGKTSVIRTSARPHGKEAWPLENMVTVRFMQAVMIKTNPNVFIEINTETDPEFPERVAKQVIETAALIAQRHGAPIQNPLT